MKTKTWFITGTSRGFGLELVRAALQRGDSVVATSRQPAAVAAAFPEAGDRLLAISLDLHSPAAVKAAVASALARFGRIDVLVNNAGHGLLGAVEEVSDSEAASVFGINVFGLHRLTRAVLPAMRAQKSGHIVNLSSIAGLTAGPGWGVYSATKFAVEGLSEALAQEVAPLGIRVTLIEPGPFRTEFLGGSLARTARTIDDYASTAGGTRAWSLANDGVQKGDPVRAVEAIVRVVTSEHPPLRLLLGASAWERAHRKVDTMLREFAEWRDVSLGADFPE
ncbi:short-chain alcohol dehydrogenase [Opitutaceae bacterium TAV1]|nr:short-chain alcohol dehydrogenase [Opitutaceae bacterium TAV1]